MLGQTNVDVRFVLLLLFPRGDLLETADMGEESDAPYGKSGRPEMHVVSWLSCLENS